MDEQDFESASSAIPTRRPTTIHILTQAGDFGKRFFDNGELTFLRKKRGT